MMCSQSVTVNYSEKNMGKMVTVCSSLQKFCVRFYCNNKILDNNTTDIPDCSHISPLVSLMIQIIYPTDVLSH
jgi:hypothetical protein